MGAGVGLHVIPGGRPELGVGVAVGVGVGITTGGVGLPVGEDEFAPQWTSVRPATDHAPKSTRGLRFMGPPETARQSYSISLGELI
jgi:hypothetical protein